MSEPELVTAAEAFEAVATLEDDLGEAIAEVVRLGQRHERAIPRELARAIERLAEAHREAERVGFMMRFDPFGGGKKAAA